jgi:hypothetical protein
VVGGWSRHKVSRTLFQFKNKLDVVIHTYNPNYVGDDDRKIED